MLVMRCLKLKVNQRMFYMLETTIATAFEGEVQLEVEGVFEVDVVVVVIITTLGDKEIVSTVDLQNIGRVSVLSQEMTA